MEFVSLLIEYDEVQRTIQFSKKTLIFSENNSVGKSTLLRFLFFGLGYSIPGTYRLKFQNAKVTVKFIRSRDAYTVIRKNEYVEIWKNEVFLDSRVLDGEDTAWFAYIWGIDSPRVLKNILGAIYMDQDKGWTLLNRGKVIGNIRFNIRDLLIGLADNSDALDDKLSILDQQKKMLTQTRQLLELGKTASNYQSSEISSIIEDDDSDLNSKYLNLKMQLRVLRHRLSQVKKSVEDESRLSDFIVSLHIMVEAHDTELVITKDNLMHFDDNIDFLRQKSALLQEEIDQVKNEISVVRDQLNKRTQNLFSRLESTDVVVKTLNDIAGIGIDQAVLEAREVELTDSVKKLSDDIESDFTSHNTLISETRGWVDYFAKKLDISDLVENRRYIFTRDLKSISGTIYYKAVFSFKMAYIKVIQNHTGLILPIVLDSPSGREVTNRNISEVIQILNDDFSENQVIVASINKYDLDGVHEVNIKKRLFE